MNVKMYFNPFAHVSVTSVPKGKPSSPSPLLNLTFLTRVRKTGLHVKAETGWFKQKK